jgi:catecholate siderophore receptor
MKNSRHITHRKHVLTGTALAMLLPLAAHAADDAAKAAAAAADEDKHQKVHIVGGRENELKADHAASPKYTEALVDTPQTIVVIKKELFEQQGATTLTEALQNTPGVGTFFLGENGNTNTGDAIYLRGFDSSGSIFVDGIRDIGSVSRDIFNTEQIDVLKGPAGTDTGRGAPTGSINLNTKQPQLRSFSNASVVAGSADRLRGTADLNQVLDRERGIAVRLNAVDQDNGNAARDVVKAKRWAVAPSVAFGLHSPTRLYLDFLHVKQDNIPDGGVPTIGLPGYSNPTIPSATAVNPPPIRPELNNPAPVDPQNFYGSRADFDRVKADMFTAIVDHDFGRRMRLRNISRYGKTKQFYLLSAFMSSGANVITQAAPIPPATVRYPGVLANDPSTWLLQRTTRTIKDQENTVLANQTTLTSEFDTGMLRHTLVSGLDLSNEKQVNYSYVNNATNRNLGYLGFLAPANLYHPDLNVMPVDVNFVRSGVRNQGEVTTASGYLLDTIKIGDKWLFGASFRVDHFDVNYDALPATGTTTPATHLELSDSVTSGKLSVLYKPTEISSVYALWANSKQPPGSSLTLSTGANSASNVNYDPQVSITTEVGTKWELMNRKLGLNAALFRTVVKNEVEQDPTNTAVYYQTGRKRVQGVELSAVGQITRDWQVSAGYSWMDTSVEQGRVITAGGENALTYTPKTAFSSWTTYTFPFGLKVGGGARYSGRLLRGTDGAVGTPAYADDYWVVDAMAGYRVARWLDLQLNVYNLGDKRYVASINKSGYRYTPGAPRWASLTANFHF